mgnify:CR=1 FL=1
MIVLNLTMVDDSLDERLDQPVLLCGTEFKIYEQHKKRGDRERTVTIIQQTGTYSFTQVAESFNDIHVMIINDRSCV